MNFKVVISSVHASGIGPYLNILLSPGRTSSKAPVSCCTVHTPSSQYAAQVSVVPAIASSSTNIKINKDCIPEIGKLIFKYAINTECQDIQANF